MKVLFLDFDGVLNHTDWWEERPDRPEAHECLAPECVDQLQRIVDETGAVVVVSSTWRLDRTVGELREILRRRGFDGEIVGKTRDGPGTHRGEQIADWLDEHDLAPDDCAIVDDCNTMYPVADRLVQTDIMEGLTAAKASALIDMLEGKKS